MLDLLVSFITSSQITLYGTVALVIAVVFAVINGIIDIAIYILTIGGALLLTIGALNQLFPGLIPV